MKILNKVNRGLVAWVTFTGTLATIAFLSNNSAKKEIAFTEKCMQHEFQQKIDPITIEYQKNWQNHPGINFYGEKVVSRTPEYKVYTDEGLLEISKQIINNPTNTYATGIIEQIIVYKPEYNQVRYSVTDRLYHYQIHINDSKPIVNVGDIVKFKLDDAKSKTHFLFPLPKFNKDSTPSVKGTIEYMQKRQPPFFEVIGNIKKYEQVVRGGEDITNYLFQTDER